MGRDHHISVKKTKGDLHEYFVRDQHHSRGEATFRPPPKGSLAKNSDDIDDHKGTHLSIWDECVM